MASIFVEEFRVGQKLKEICDENGKETDPATAAKLLHRLGQIHRMRSPDKISLIQSVGLFNAAIVRNPSNISQIKSDLFEVCQHILQLADAYNQHKDLVEKANDVKTSVIKLRREVTEIVHKFVPKIPLTASNKQLALLRKDKTQAVQTLNEMIATEYTKIMANIGQFCEGILGPLHCEYAVVGLGSLATQTITPYSDFDHMILVEDHCDNPNLNLEYFRWYSTIFHVIILNLQETIIPELNILGLTNIFCYNAKDVKNLDWYCDEITPRGISCGSYLPYISKNIIRRNHLIDSFAITQVSEVWHYHSSSFRWKPDYLFADLLGRSCFVFGKMEIFEQYKDLVKMVKKCHFIESRPIRFCFVKDDLLRFSARTAVLNAIHDSHVMTIYRSTTLFISTLAEIHDISSNSSFGAIEELAKRNKISTSTANKLRLSVAVASEFRLKVFMENKSWTNSYAEKAGKNVKTFSHFVGAADAISYFQIAYCLQCEVAKQLNMNYFYPDPHQLNVLICSALQMPDALKFFEPVQKHFFKISEFDFDNYIEQLEAEIQLNPSKFEKLRRQFFKNLELKIIEIASVYREKLLSTNSNTSSFANYKPPHQSTRSTVLPSLFSTNSSTMSRINPTSLAGTAKHSSLYQKMLSTVLALHFLKKFSNYISSPFIKKSRTIIPNFRLKPDQVTSIAKHVHGEVVL